MSAHVGVSFSHKAGSHGKSKFQGSSSSSLATAQSSSASVSFVDARSTGGASTSTDQSGKRPSRTSKTSRKSFFANIHATEAARQVAMFANNIAMDEEEDYKTAEGEKTYDVSENDEKPEETGADRLDRAYTAEVNQKGLHRFTLHSAGIEPEVLMRVALEDEWQMLSCASLPFTVVFFVIFMMFFQLHYRVTDMYLAEAAIRAKLVDSARKVDEAVDLYDWLENHYFPFLWNSSRDDVHDNPHKLTATSLFQELVAGVRVTTASATKKRCEDDIVNHRECYSDIITSTLSGNGVFGRRLQANKDGMSQADTDSQERSENAREVMQARREKLPTWATSSLSERWLDHERNAKQTYAVQQPTKRTAQAFDWTQAMSKSPTRQKLSVGDRPQRRRKRVAHLFGLQSSNRLPASALVSGEEQRRSGQNSSSQLGVFEAVPADFGASEMLNEAVVEGGERDRRLRANRPELRKDMPQQGDGRKSQMIIPKSWSLQEVLAEVQKWKTNKVIQETTLTFVAEALVLNKNVPRELLISIVIEFSMHRGGNVWAEVKIVSLIFTEMASDVIRSCTGILWALCLLSFSLMLPSRAINRWKQGRLRAHCCRFWNFLEWGIILWGWLVLGTFVLERAWIWDLKSDITDYNNERLPLPPWDHAALDRSNLAKFLDATSSLTDLSSWCQTCVALYHIILVCRFFLASRGQPRLAVVLTTIRKASVDLGHLLIVFMVVFLGFVISGHILFGRRIEGFATFRGSFARCFQIVMEREYTWVLFTEEEYRTAAVWVFSFMILVVLVLVNLFLAMIFDTYGDVRSSVGHSASILQTSTILLTHLKHSLRLSARSTRWAPNRDIVQAVKNMQCHYVTPWMVKDAIPGISNNQINYIFHLGRNRLETMYMKSHKSSLPAVLSSILLGVEKMSQGITMMENKVSITSLVQPATELELRLKEETAKLAPPQKHAPPGGSHRSPRFGEEEEIAMVPPVHPPAWLKVQLSPHFHKQKKLLTQVQQQIRKIENSIKQRGLTLHISPLVGCELRKVSSSPEDKHGLLLLPESPSIATSGPGRLPATLRAGLTAPGEDKPLAEPISMRQPNG